MIKGILIVLLFFYSCREASPGIIKQSSMQDILWDISKANALSQELIKKDSGNSLATKAALLNDQVFAIHKITREQFEKSYAYYTNHPDILKIMLDSINALQTKKIYHEIPVAKKIIKDTFK